jgi:hypothetical protein
MGDAEEVRKLALALADSDLLYLADLALACAHAVVGDNAAALDLLDAIVQRDLPLNRRLMILAIRGDALVEERPAEALACYAECVAKLKAPLNEPVNLAFVLDGIAMGLAGLRRDIDSLTVAGVAERCRREGFVTIAPGWRDWVQKALTPVLERLDVSEIERCRTVAATIHLPTALDWIEQLARERAAGDSGPIRPDEIALPRPSDR